MKIEVKSLNGETLTDVILRIFGTINKGFFEKTLATNPHLMFLPLRLPANTLIVLEKNQGYEEKETVNLWD